MFELQQLSQDLTPHMERAFRENYSLRFWVADSRSCCFTVGCLHKRKCTVSLYRNGWPTVVTPRPRRKLLCSKEITVAYLQFAIIFKSIGRKKSLCGQWKDQNNMFFSLKMRNIVFREGKALDWIMRTLSHLWAIYSGSHQENNDILYVQELNLRKCLYKTTTVSLKVSSKWRRIMAKTDS